MGGFSPAKVPRPRPPLSRFRRPGRPFFSRPQDAPYDRLQYTLHHTRLRLEERPIPSDRRCLAVVLTIRYIKRYNVLFA
jgi:hypothetical protein